MIRVANRLQVNNNYMINNVGPMPERCTIERVIMRIKEQLSPTLEIDLCQSRMIPTHLIILCGRFNSLSF